MVNSPILPPQQHGDLLNGESPSINSASLANQQNSIRNPSKYPLHTGKESLPQPHLIDVAAEAMDRAGKAGESLERAQTFGIAAVKFAIIDSQAGIYARNPEYLARSKAPDIDRRHP